MQTDHSSINKKHVPIVWYKVPILWLMFALLGFTVVSGVAMFIMAHNTKDSLVIDSKLTPLSKKLALPENINPSKKAVD